MASLAVKRDGYAVIRGPNVIAPVAIPCQAVLTLSRLIGGLPRGFEDIAVSPGDFETELRVDGITTPHLVQLYHRLRRVWVTTVRNRPKGKK